MAKSKTDILTEAEIYIRQWYQREMPPEMVFHSFHHTRELVKTVKKLAEKENLDGPSVELLTLAGWFQ